MIKELLRALFGRTQRASAGVPSYGMIPPLGSVPSASGLLVSQATAMGVATVYACVNRRSLDVARCPPSLYRPLEDGSRETVTDHPLAKLFVKPNRVQSWFEFVEQLMVGYLLRGNAYAAILRDRRGNPTELIPINPDAVMVLEAADGSIFHNTNRIGLWQIAMLRDFPVAIPAEDMLHLRGLSFNSLVGVSKIGLARDAIGLGMGLEQQASRWMGSGARPSGVLESPTKLTDSAAKRLKAQWEAYTAGVENTGRTAVLEEGVVWKPLQLTSVDLEFMKQRDFQVLDICRFFNVPPHKVWVVDRAASMSIPQQDQNYMNETIAPDLERLEQLFEHTFDLAEDGLKVDFNERNLLRADIMTRRNAARLGILSGLTTPDEERLAEGLRARGGAADELLVPANTAALGSEMTGTAPDGAGRPPKGEPPEPGVGTGGKQPNASELDNEPPPEDAAPSG
jgi:HK97 family phage portal protein